VLKSELIDRFVSGDPEVLATLTSLVVVAHPDDESIGAGSRLQALGNTWVVAVTDGAPQDFECARSRGFETREAYAEARDRELRQALAVAGVPEDHLLKLEIPDGGATLRLVEVCRRIAEIIDRVRPDVVVTHPYEGGHTDHDATAFAVHLACGILRREKVRPPAILELTSYHALDGQKVVQQFLPHEGADRELRLVKLDDAERALKQAMFDAFATQQRVLEQFSTHFEQFRPAPRYLFTEAPHPGVLNYERYGQPNRGRTWREHAEHVLRLLRMRRG
jgi:LmbE family N-acetylglucosaminyl deacetylase